MVNEKIMDAKKSAEEIVAMKKENGKYVISDSDLFQYRGRLTKALEMKEKYDFLNIMLAIAVAADTGFDFLYDMIDDFEPNINLGISFVNALHRKKL